MSAHSNRLARRRTALVLTAALALSGTAHAAFTVYTDEAAFLAAVGAVQHENFDEHASDIPAGSIAVGDFTIRGGAIDAPPTAYAGNGSTQLYLRTSYGGWSDLQFDGSLRAFGGWFEGLPANVTVKVDADSLEGYGSYRHLGTLPANTGTGRRFIGFTADSTFNRIVFEGAGCCSSSTALDDVVYAASLTPVPEPSGAALLLAGAGWLVWRRRGSR